MKHMKKPSLVMLAALAVAAQGGCCRFVRRYPVPSPSDMVGAVRKANEHPRSMRAKVTADQRTKKGRLKATVYLLANRKGGLRMEATVLDNTVAVLTSDGQRFYSIDFKHKVVYLGPARPCNIARIFGIPLRPGQVGLVLMGGMPLLRHSESRVSWDKCRGTEVLWLRNADAGLEQKIWIRRTKMGWRVERSVVRDRKGRTLLSVEFKKFVRRAGAWMPTWIRYIQKGVGTDALLRYQKVEADMEIPDEAYRIEPPAGYPVRWLDCEERQALPFEAVNKGRAPKKPTLSRGSKANPARSTGSSVTKEERNPGPDPRLDASGPSAPPLTPAAPPGAAPHGEKAGEKGGRPRQTGDGKRE